jgi:hypothetical protein
MAGQLAAASKQRLLRRLGVLTPDDLAAVVRAVASPSASETLQMKVGVGTSAPVHRRLPTSAG